MSEATKDNKKVPLSDRVSDDGISVIEECKVDKEQVKKVRRINLIEPFVVYAIALAIVWGTGMDEDNPFLYPSLGVLVFWILFVSPYWHYEKLNEKEIYLRPEQRNLGYWYLECRGLGSPIQYYKKDENGVRGFVKHKDAIGRMLVLWDVLILCLPFAFQDDYAEIVISIFGTATPGYQLLAMVILLIAADIVMVLVMFPIMMRLDNFIEGWDNQLKTSLKVGIPLVFVLNLFFIIFWEDLLVSVGTEGAFGMKGDDPFTRILEFNIFALGGRIAGYVAWGFLQQLLFLSVF